MNPSLCLSVVRLLEPEPTWQSIPESEIANAPDEFGLLLDVSISQNISLSDLASYAAMVMKYLGLLILILVVSATVAFINPRLLLPINLSNTMNLIGTACHLRDLGCGE